MFVTAFILGLVLVIMFHEFGHYATAKLFGMRVERFFLGFGPTLWSFRRGETEYGVKAIPAGGFVKITGMSAFEEVPEEARGRTFHSKPAWQRAIVLVAGAFTHFIVAAVVIFAALAFVGAPRASNTVDFVVDESPAAEAGVREGDRIVAVDGTETAEFEAVREAIRPAAGREIALRVERDGATEELQVAIADRHPDGTPGGFLGVAPRPESVPSSPWQAAVGTISGPLSVPSLTAQTAVGLAQVFNPAELARWIGTLDDPGPRDLETPMSPYGAAQATGALLGRGEIFAVLLIIAQLNIVLGTVNLIPLPPLDGGHLAVLGVEESVNAVRRRRGRSGTFRVDPAVLTPIALMVILFFVVVSFTAIYADITKPITDLLQ